MNRQLDIKNRFWTSSIIRQIKFLFLKYYLYKMNKDIYKNAQTYKALSKTLNKKYLSQKIYHFLREKSNENRNMPSGLSKKV